EESGQALLGVSEGARSVSVGLPPDPPEGSRGVQVILLKKGTPLAVDVRNGSSRREEWEVLVRWTGVQRMNRTDDYGEVVLTFDGVGYAPKDKSVWLVDLSTGKRLYLRTQHSYRFRPERGETERRFKVIAETGNERSLRIVGVKTSPVRGEGIVLEFGLTKEAQVTVEVLTLMGRRVALVEAQKGRSEGTHRVLWRRTNSDGRELTQGRYLIKITATDADGRQVQAMTIASLR
ncbi:MAG: hypothetical protein NZ959_11170, partial [Armatimonadetes bacterium]|nr:hypothetical protein [Armatimonadota bacterium]